MTQGAASAGHVDYRTLVEQIPCITYTEVHDARTATGQRTTYVSPQASRILGYSPAEFLADPELWRRIRHPADRANVMAAERTAEVTRRPFHSEYRMYARDGRMLWFRDDAVIVEDPAGGGTFWQGVMFDITSERTATEHATMAELRYRSLVETLPATVFVDELDEQATNIYTSPQTQAMFGFAPKDWKDIPDLWVRLIHPDDRARVLAAQERYADGRDETFDLEYRMVARDGRTLWVRDVAFLVRDADGTPVYSQGFFLDITEQKEAERVSSEALERERRQGERLARLDALKNAMLASLSDDLRAPLTAILASANALQRPELEFEDDEGRRLVANISARARRIQRLLDDLVELDRLGRAGVEPDRRCVDVADVVRDLVEDDELLEGRRLELHLSPATAEIDVPKVRRIVENLLTHAVHHTPSGAAVRVEVAPAEGGVLIAVDDEGPGVADHLKQALFEPLREVIDVGGTAHAVAGNVGLSLVARFAEVHGGRAWVQDRPGHGSSFRVLLPSAVAGPAAAPSQTKA